MSTTTISVKEEFSTLASVDDVWAVFIEPRVVVQCLPGTSIVEMHENGEIDGEMKVKLGPTEVCFAGTVVPTFDEATHTGVLEATGADGRGRTRAGAHTTFTVDEADPHGTRVRIDGSVTVSGPLAPFVRTGGTHLTKRLVGEFAENLQQLVEPPASTVPAPTPVAVSDPAAGDAADPEGEDAAPSAAAPGPPGGRPLTRGFLGFVRRTVRKLLDLFGVAPRRKDRSK